MDSSAPLDPTRAAPPAADAPPADVVARLQAELPGRVDVSVAALEAAGVPYRLHTFDVALDAGGERLGEQPRCRACR